MPWIVYVADDGQEPEEIARASDHERAEAFRAIAKDLARRDGLFDEITVRWEEGSVGEHASRAVQ